MQSSAPDSPTRLTQLYQAVRSLLPERPLRSVRLWLIVLVNIALIALYFWSRGGATTDIRIEAQGNDYRAFVDGELVAEGTFRGPTEGGIGLRLVTNYRLPALPKPFGYDSVRVTEIGTNEVLFEDDFEGGFSPLLADGKGEWSSEDGALTTTSNRSISTGFQEWGDYVFQAKLKNITEATIYVRLQDLNNAVVLGIGQFRGFGGIVLARLEDGVSVERIESPRIELDRGESIQSITAMLLRPYPYALLVFAALIAVVFVVRVGALERRVASFSATMSEVAPAIAIGLAAGSLVLLWYLLYVVGEAIPHVPDSVAYTFQAKIFASFRFAGDAPPLRESFSIFNPHMFQVVDGRWFSHYPFGHPMFLAIGEFFGVIWLVPPILGAACIALTYAIGKRLYSSSTGLIAAALLLSSPFFLMTASNFMSHNTAAFTLLAALLLITWQTKRKYIAMFVAGAFIGLLFNIRPFTAVAFMPVLGLFMAYELVRARAGRLRLLLEDLSFAAAALLMLGAHFFYNRMTTGDFNTTAYEAQGTFTDDFVGFGGLHSVTLGIQNEQELLSLLLLVANGWPLVIGLLVAAFPFLLGTKNKWDYFLGASFLAIVSAPIFYRNSAIMHGPRFWYEGLPFLILLTARGFQTLKDAAIDAGDTLACRFRKNTIISSSAGATFAVYGGVVILILFSTTGWLFGQRDMWTGTGVLNFTPNNASQLEGFNFTDRRLPDKAEELNIEDALILVESCPHWWCFGSVFWLNDPDLDGDIVWAELQETEDDIELLELYKGRQLYVASYGFNTIEPISEEQIVQRVEEKLAEAKEPQEPVDPRTPSERDAIRRADLETARAALEVYAQENATYPVTGNGVQTLCAYTTLDAGCALAVTSADPLGAAITNGYWLRSNGTSYVLIALQEVETTEPSACPDDLQFGQSRYCVVGELP